MYYCDYVGLVYIISTKKSLMSAMCVHEVYYDV